MRFTYLRSQKAVVRKGETICRVDTDFTGEMIAAALNPAQADTDEKTDPLEAVKDHLEQQREMVDRALPRMEADPAPPSQRILPYTQLKRAAIERLQSAAGVDVTFVLRDCCRILRDPAAWGPDAMDLAENVLTVLVRNLKENAS